MPEKDQTDATLSTGFKFAGALWPVVGGLLTFVISVLGAWYSTKLDTQAQFADVHAQIEAQALTDSKTFATKAELTDIQVTLGSMMKTMSEIRSDVMYVRGRVDQLVK